jgi:hypothetical protein
MYCIKSISDRLEAEGVIYSIPNILGSRFHSYQILDYNDVRAAQAEKDLRPN